MRIADSLTFECRVLINVVIGAFAKPFSSFRNSVDTFIFFCFTFKVRILFVYLEFLETVYPLVALCSEDLTKLYKIKS